MRKFDQLRLVTDSRDLGSKLEGARWITLNNLRHAGILSSVNGMERHGGLLVPHARFWNSATIFPSAAELTRTSKGKKKGCNGMGRNSSTTYATTRISTA